jgi:signal transduction histidine kinase
MSAVISKETSNAGRILVVDDSWDNLFIMKTVLEAEGYEVQTIESGSAALIGIEQFPPDLVILDVRMPEMDGYEVTRRIRQNQNIPYIPILLISAYDQANVAYGLDLGADDFVRKPVEFDELMARIRSLMRLKRSIDERDLIVRQREDFVSRLAHDLRTPLFAADRILKLFQQGALGELSSEMLEIIATMDRSNQNLLQMVNTLLEVYRYEASRKIINFVRVDLRELIHQVTQALAPLIQEKELELNLALSDSDEESSVFSGVVMGDRLELHRLLMNLLANAIKFTDQGSITVRLMPTTAPPTIKRREFLWARLEVEDTGVGIRPEEQSFIFERFRQGSNRHGGSGLGLHLSRLIVEVHRGTISVQSEQGKGSVFIVCLPTDQ